MSRKGLQIQCAICYGYFYEETMRQNDAGLFLCDSCFNKQLLTKGEYLKKSTIPEIPVIGGLPLLEILGVVAILGLMAAFMFNFIMPMRQKAKMSDLEFTFFKNQDTEIGRLASEAMSLIEREQSLINIINIAKNKPQELAQLENELARLGKSKEAAARFDETQVGEIEELVNHQRLNYRKALEKFGNLATIDPGDYEKLENELRECLKWDNQPQQMGAAIKAIQEWQKMMEGGQR